MRDFLVLDQEAAQAPRLEKAPLAAVIMLAVILSAILGSRPSPSRPWRARR